MASPNDSLTRFMAHGREFSIWHEDEAQALWINARNPAGGWESGITVSLYEDGVKAAGGAEAWVKGKALPAFNAYVAKFAPTGGPAPLPAPSFPLGPLETAVRELVASRVKWSGTALVVA